MIAKDIRALATALRETGRHITIETAATIAPDGIACDLASLSPKLLNSAPDPLNHATWVRLRQITGSAIPSESTPRYLPEIASPHAMPSSSARPALGLCQ